jgi:transposase
MARPYSMDLRDRLIGAVREGMSARAAAERFGVGVATGVRWARQFRATGSVAPGRMGGHKKRAIAGAHREWLLVRCRDQNFTLRGLVAELAGRGLKVDYRAVWVFVHDERLSYKKNSVCWRAGAARHRAPARTVAAVSGED